MESWSRFVCFRWIGSHLVPETSPEASYGVLMVLWEPARVNNRPTSLPLCHLSVARCHTANTNLPPSPTLVVLLGVKGGVSSNHQIPTLPDRPLAGNEVVSKFNYRIILLCRPP